VYTIGHLDWSTRIRFAAAVVVSVALVSTIGFSPSRMWDPLGAVSLTVVRHPAWVFVKLAAVAAVAACLGTVIMDARLPDCGAFVSLVGLAYLPMRTAGMDYVMVRLQDGKAPAEAARLWFSLASETLAWAVVLVLTLLVGRAVELWLNAAPEGDTKAKKLSAGDLVPAAGGKALLAVGLTAVIAATGIFLFAVTGDKGQVLFAVAVSFFLGAWASERAVGSSSCFWQVLAAPVLAMAAYVYTYYHPQRPAPYEGLLNIAPNNLVRALPIEYISAGGAGAIFGTWFSHRLRRDHRQQEPKT